MLAGADPRGRAARPCLLEWLEWSKDRTMGLNHQLASLSCALAEAYYLNRTLLLPDRLCIDAKHDSRWGQRHEPDPHCTANGVRGFSVPISDILDLHLLSQFVSVLPTRLPRVQDAVAADGVPAVRLDRKWTSARAAAAHPCGAKHARLLQRRVSGFWFRPCGYGITDGQALLRRVHRAVRARGAHDAGQVATHLLRSGSWSKAPCARRPVALRGAGPLLRSTQSVASAARKLAAASIGAGDAFSCGGPFARAGAASSTPQPSRARCRGLRLQP